MAQLATVLVRHCMVAMVELVEIIDLLVYGLYSIQTSIIQLVTTGNGVADCQIYNRVLHHAVCQYILQV